MESKFEVVSLSSLSKNNKGYYGIGASAVPYSEDLYTYLRITDINDDGTLNKSDLKSVNDDKAEEYILEPNDIVFARTGASTGRNYFYDGSDGQFVYAGFLIKFSIDESKVNPKYIKYYCLSKQYRDWINSFNTGSTRGNINAQTLGNMPIPLPPQSQQDKLVSILSDIDSKIKLNNEINSNLEQQAQAIFKSWFVNFENLDESIVGSWELQKLGNIACFSQGTQVPIEDQLFVPTEGYTRFIRIIDVTQPSNQDIRYIKDTKKGKVTSSDIFMIRYGTPGIVARNYAGIIANNLFKITPTTEKVTSNYLYHFLKSSDVQNYITQNAVSSTMPAINFSTLKNLEIIIPDDMTMKKFSSLSEAIRVKQLELSKENLHLSSIRDTLLPKLMSGEIDLSSIDI